MPLILGTDGAKLSKRHGGVSVEEYKRDGFLPEALANYLILLGWMPKDGREVMPPDEAVKLFEISEMNDVQAKFDIQKLRWLNAEYIMKILERAPDPRSSGRTSTRPASRPPASPTPISPRSSTSTRSASRP